MNYFNFAEIKNMEKATEVEELEKIKEDDEPMIRMSFDGDTEMFIYYKEYNKRKEFPICAELVERIVMEYSGMRLLLVGEVMRQKAYLLIS